MQKQQVENELLIEGAKSYPQALAALSEFRRGTFEAIREILKPSLSEVGKALGIANLRYAEVVNRARPDELGGSIDGEEAALGVVIRREKEEGWRQYYHFRWDKEYGFYFSISIRFGNSKRASELAERFTQTNSKNMIGFDPEDRELWLLRTIHPEEMEQIGDIVRDVVREWIVIWKKLGGLRAAL